MSICRSIQQAISVYSRNATRGTGVIARSTDLIRASRATSLLSSNPYSSALNDNNNNRAASFSSSTYRPIVAATTSTATTPELQNDQRFPTEIEDRVQQILKKFAPPGGSPAPTVGALCDSHAEDPGRIALFYKEASGRRDKYTFREMMFLSSNFANVLRSLGVQKGDRVGILLPKTPELMIAALGLWRIGAAYVPLFTAFGPDAIEYRLSNSGAKVVITDSNNRPKLDSVSLTSGPSASVSIVTVTNNGSSVSAKPSTTTTARTSGAREIDFWKELNASSAFEVVEPEPMSGDDLLSIIYTSGTTGNPKGVEIPVRALAAFQIYMEYAIHLEKGDMFWNLADPGDVVCQTDDNNLVFSGRDDDIISSAGFRIGPFEVESALMKHTAVAECAVVGVPDELRGERVKAFVVTRPGVVQDEKLQEELKQFVKQHLSAHEYPREIEFLDALPKTPGGKIQRYLLRKRGQQ